MHALIFPPLDFPLPTGLMLDLLLMVVASRWGEGEIPVCLMTVHLTRLSRAPHGAQTLVTAHPQPSDSEQVPILEGTYYPCQFSQSTGSGKESVNHLTIQGSREVTDKTSQAEHHQIDL